MQTLGAGILVWNGAECISRCIESIRDNVCEIHIAVDIKTTDNSKQTLDSMGLKYTDYEWKTAGQARNTVIDKFTLADWILLIDQDEEILPKDMDKIKSTINTTDKSAIHVIRKNWLDLDRETGIIDFRFDYPDRVTRIIRRTSGLRFVGTVHEGIECDRLITDIEIQHYAPAYRLEEPKEYEKIRREVYNKALAGNSQ